jgi:hypothetical protein
MSDLLAYRNTVDERIVLLEPTLGLDIVVDLLKLERNVAADWIKANGDPTEMPAAVVLLAHATKINADTLLATGVEMQRKRSTFSIALLAHQMMGLLLNAIMLFRKEPDRPH